MARGAGRSLPLPVLPACKLTFIRHIYTGDEDSLRVSVDGAHTLHGRGTKMHLFQIRFKRGGTGFTVWGFNPSAAPASILNSVRKRVYWCFVERCGAGVFFCCNPFPASAMVRHAHAACAWHLLGPGVSQVPTSVSARTDPPPGGSRRPTFLTPPPHPRPPDKAAHPVDRPRLSSRCC